MIIFLSLCFLLSVTTWGRITGFASGLRNFSILWASLSQDILKRRWHQNLQTVIIPIPRIVSLELNQHLHGQGPGFCIFNKLHSDSSGYHLGNYLLDFRKGHCFTWHLHAEAFSADTSGSEVLRECDR